MILNQITIPCLNYSASVAFYEALGMVKIVEAPPRYARFESADGSGATLSLHAVTAPVGSGPVIYFDHPSADASVPRVVDGLRREDGGAPSRHNVHFEVGVVALRFAQKADLSLSGMEAVFIF